MKKFLLGILLPVLTLVTIIGTGFATWYFDENFQSKTTNVNVEVVNYAVLGSFDTSATTANKITLDQPANSQNPTDGVLLNGIIKGVYTHGHSTADKSNLVVTCTITVDAALAAYIDLTTLGNFKKTTDGKGTANDVYTCTLNNSGDTVEIKVGDFGYKTGKVPTSVADYTTMKNAKITVVFNAVFNK